MKKSKWLFLCFCLTASFLFAVAVSAATYGSLTYKISNGEVTITGCDKSASGALVIPAEIKGDPVMNIGALDIDIIGNFEEIENYPVTSIGDEAFQNCSKLTSITIPSSVTSIGDRAFDDCHSLTNIEMPSSVTSIGGGAFYNCRSLTSVAIPSSVTSIGDWAFEGCRALTSITVNASNPSYSSDTQGILYNKDKTKLICSPTGTPLKSITIPSSVTSIWDGAFEDCRSLTSVLIPSSVVSIGKSAFYDCRGLTSITIPSSVSSIGDWAFYNCSKFTRISIPSSVTSIGDYAFYGCSGLTSITIPSSVTSIGDGAFSCCSGLENIDGNLIYIKTTDNPYFYLEGRISEDIISCEINANCKFIGVATFRDCRALTSISIPSSVVNIGNRAFYECDALSDIYYGGSEAEWRLIDIERLGNNPLLNAKKHFAYPLKNEGRTDAIVLAVGKLKMWAFGNMVQNDAAPKIVNSRTMVPIRFIAEALGATVGWDGATRTATVTKGNKTVEIPIGGENARVNGAEVALDSPAFIENGRTYLPLRFVVESLDAEVEWDGEVQEIIITK